MFDDLGVACEKSTDAGLIYGLRALGHDLTVEAPDDAFGFDGAQIVQKLPSGGYIVGTDPRKDGAAVSY